MRFHESQKGFTLVEMLVVIGIIGILSSILLPVILGQVEKARDAQCKSNLRQIGLGAFAFASDHRFYPFDKPERQIKRSDERSSDHLEVLSRLYRSGYIMDTRLFFCPSSTDLAGEASPEPEGFKLEDGACSYTWRAGLLAVAGKGNKATEVLAADRRAGDAHHGRHVNVLYADGHVDRVELEDVEGMAKLDAQLITPVEIVKG